MFTLKNRASVDLVRHPKVTVPSCHRQDIPFSLCVRVCVCVCSGLVVLLRSCRISRSSFLSTQPRFHAFCCVANKLISSETKDGEVRRPESNRERQTCFCTVVVDNKVLGGGKCILPALVCWIFTDK